MRTVAIMCMAALSFTAMRRSNSGYDSKPHFEWKRLVEHAPWAKGYNFQMFSLRDTLWVFHPDGTWYSVNGRQWSKSVLSNVIFNHAFLDYVLVRGKILGLGRLEGNIEKYQWQSTIFRTDNRKTWKKAAQTSNLPERFFYHPFTFQDKIWIIGGENKSVQFGDIWNSADGIHWKSINAHAAFGKRSNSRVVQLGHQLFLLNNDVWSSTDGTNWRRECNEIIPGQEIFGYDAVVFQDRIWLLGCNRNGRFESKVVSSSDGKNWSASEAPWSPRGGVAACTHKGAIYITGGKFGGHDTNHPDFEYSNDVWVMQPRTAR